MGTISSLTLMTVAWSILSIYLAVFYSILFFQMKERKEYFFQSALAICTGSYTFSHVWLSDFFSEIETLSSIQTGLAFLFFANPVFLSFSYIFCRKKITKFIWLNYGYGLLGAVLSFSGHLHETIPVIRYVTWGGILDFAYTDFSLNTLGGVLLFGMWIFFTRGCFVILMDAKINQYARILVPGVVINVVAVSHDLLVMTFGLNSIYLFDHTAVAALLSLSFVLTSRFMDTKKELRATNEELAKSFQKLNLAQEKMRRQKRLAAEGELSAMVAHEVRNPLSVIQNALVSIRRSPSKEKKGILTDIIQEETKKLIGIREELQMIGSPVEMQFSLFETKPFIKNVIEAAEEGRGPLKGVSVNFDISQAPQYMKGDPKWLHHAMVNIVENAFEAMSRGGVLTVKVLEEPDVRKKVLFIFMDTGEGMDEETSQRILQPFFTTKGTGTGLGLAIVDRIVQGHQGKIDIKSRKGEGSQFVLQLPIEIDATLNHKHSPIQTSKHWNIGVS